MNTKAGEGTRAGTVAVGIDVGGTFTDLAAVHDDGAVSTSKVLSVPGDRAQECSMRCKRPAWPRRR